MTQEEHNILIENNIMLKRILAYVQARATPNAELKDFISNTDKILLCFDLRIGRFTKK